MSVTAHGEEGHGQCVIGNVSYVRPDQKYRCRRRSTPIERLATGEFMKVSIALKAFIMASALLTLIGCGGGGSNSVTTPPPTPQQGTAQVSISLHDMPPTGVTALSFQATITGMTMQPGNVSVLTSPITLEMTQLQGMSAYMGTVSLPVGTYTGMTIILANAQMTFLNNT